MIEISFCFFLKVTMLKGLLLCSIASGCVIILMEASQASQKLWKWHIYNKWVYAPEKLQQELQILDWAIMEVKN